MDAGSIPPAKTVAPVLSDGRGLKRLHARNPLRVQTVAPVLSDGRGLKQSANFLMHSALAVAPVLSDGRGLKLIPSIAFPVLARRSARP